MFRLREGSARVVDTFLLAAAANEEAERLGHAEIGSDHVLLGLIAVGGRAADLLRHHGVTLTRARLAVAEVQRRDLESLGIDAPDTSVEPPARYASWSRPLSPPAAVVTSADATDDLAVLGRLLADPDGPAARLLAQLGVELGGSDLDTARADQDVAEPIGAWQSTHSVVVPVARASIWALIDEPSRRPSWDTDVHEVVVLDDDHILTRAPGFLADSRLARVIATGVDGDVHHSRTTRDVGHVIEWRTAFPRRGHVEHLRIELEDDLAGTRMTLSHRDERRGAGLGSRVLRWMSAGHLRLVAQAITQAAS